MSPPVTPWLGIARSTWSCRRHWDPITRPIAGLDSRLTRTALEAVSRRGRRRPSPLACRADSHGVMLPATRPALHVVRSGAEVNSTPWDRGRRCRLASAILAGIQHNAAIDHPIMHAHDVSTKMMVTPRLSRIWEHAAACH